MNRDITGLLQASLRWCLALDDLRNRRSSSHCSGALPKFARIVRQRPMVVGERREDRLSLEALINDLGLSECVALPGFVKNPYPYLRAASVFALSSAWEGLPTVLIEALVCTSLSVSRTVRAAHPTD